MGRKRKHNLQRYTNLAKAREVNRKNCFRVVGNESDCAPKKSERKKRQNLHPFPRYCRVAIVCNGVRRQVLDPVIRARIITRRTRQSKPSCVTGVLREPSGVPRGLEGGYHRKLRALHGLNAKRIRVQNQKHNAARNARSAAATRERRARQKEVILEAQQKLQHVCQYQKYMSVNYTSISLFNN